jgi:hypothetical protein
LKINFGFNQGRFHQSFQNISPHKKNVSIYVWCLNATFSNISAISRQPVLVVEEAGVPKRTTDHGEATGKLYHLRCESSAPFLVIYKARREPMPYW